METVKLKSLGELTRELKKLGKRAEKRAKAARRRAAQKTAAHVRRNIPVAFSELRDSVEAKGETVIADAPHAAAVEKGSRPHRPPIEPLIRWVKLRGMQGLTTPGRMKRIPGTTTVAHATRVAKQIRAISDASGYSDWSGGATDADAPRQIAFQIAAAIAKKGTKPHHYMAKAVPKAREILAVELQKELAELHKG